MSRRLPDPRGLLALLLPRRGPGPRVVLRVLVWVHCAGAGLRAAPGRRRVRGLGTKSTVGTSWGTREVTEERRGCRGGGLPVPARVTGETATAFGRYRWAMRRKRLSAPCSAGAVRSLRRTSSLEGGRPGRSR